MMMKPSVIIVWLMAFGPASLALAQECRGRLGADFGYRFISCAGCLGVKQFGAREYTTFSDEPVLHEIRRDGPGVGKLDDNDTLVAVNGYPITTLEAAMLLSEWKAGPVEFSLRKGGVPRKESVTPAPVCIAERPDKFTPQVAGEARLGVAIECKRCRVGKGKDGRERWRYPAPPMLLEVLQGGPGQLAGLMKGDTLVSVDGFPITSDSAGERLGSVSAGRKMRWAVRRKGATYTLIVDPDARAVFPPRAASARTWKVGGATVEVIGEKAEINRDSKTGELILRVDSTVIRIRPPS
jgi:hypothetical protein